MVEVSKLTVAVFGDFLNDVYHIGTADRISPEAPIPVVKISETKLFPGGAGNVMANLEALGVETTVCFPGWNAAETHYPIKNRLMVGDNQIARWDEDDECSPVYWDVMIDRLKADAVIVADYGKGSITDRLIEQIQQFKGPIFVDTKRDPSIWAGVATAVFPNEREYNQFKFEYDTFPTEGGLVILKQGANGLVLWNGKDYETFSPSQARFVRSVNGAGDSVIAAFVYKWLVQMQEYAYYEEGRDYEELLDFANAAAAIAVEHPYTYAPNLKEVGERYYAIS